MVKYIAGYDIGFGRLMRPLCSRLSWNSIVSRSHPSLPDDSWVFSSWRAGCELGQPDHNDADVDSHQLAHIRPLSFDP